jgi:hypothetical protein
MWWCALCSDWMKHPTLGQSIIPSAWELGPGKCNFQEFEWRHSSYWNQYRYHHKELSGKSISVGRRRKRTFRVEHETARVLSSWKLKTTLKNFIPTSQNTKPVDSCLHAQWNGMTLTPHPPPRQPFHNFVTNLKRHWQLSLGEEQKQPTHLFKSRISYRWILFQPE